MFIGFIDDLVGPFIDTLHCLFHTDNTTIISTNRFDIVAKCNHMMQFCADNESRLNFSKGKYLTINGKVEDVKEAVKLENGF